MKSFLSVLIMAFAITFQTQAVQHGEVCELLSIQKDEVRGLPGLLTAKELSILNERPFYNNAPNFPVVQTSIGITYGERPSTRMRLYKTEQYTSFVDMDGRVIQDINNHEDEFFAVYSHVYQDHVPGKHESTLTVQHFQHVITDHWSSVKAVVRYQYKSLSNNPSRAFADQVYTFKCADYHKR